MTHAQPSNRNYVQNYNKHVQVQYVKHDYFMQRCSQSAAPLKDKKIQNNSTSPNNTIKQGHKDSGRSKQKNIPRKNSTKTCGVPILSMWQRHSYGGPRRKTPKKFMHKQYKLYTRRHLLKISFEKIFQKIFRKNLSPLHLPPKLSPEEKSLSPRTQTRPLPDSNPPFPAPGPNPSSITPLIPLKIPSTPLPYNITKIYLSKIVQRDTHAKQWLNKLAFICRKM